MYLRLRAERLGDALRAYVGRITPPPIIRACALGYRTLFFLPLLSGAVFLYMLAFSSQLQHVYLACIEHGDVPRAALGLFVVLLLCALLYAWNSRLGTEAISEVYAEHADLNFDRRLASIRDAKAAASFLLPLLGLVAGLAQLWLETLDVERIVRPAAIREVSTGVLVIALAAAAVMCACAWALYAMQPQATLLARRYVFKFSGAAALFTALLPFLAKGETVALATAIGPLAMTGLVMITMTMAVIVLSRRPLLLFLPLAAFVVLVIGWGRSELPSLGQLDGQGAIARQTATAYFDSWLEERGKGRSAHGAFGGKPYPVFIMALEGGGIYAAAAAAHLLSTLQDRCPSFAEHVFAISAVSGGALGASVFGALTGGPLVRDDGACAKIASARTEPLAQRAGAIVGADHLSGPLAFLIPDIMRKFDFGLFDWLGDRALRLGALVERLGSAGGRIACLRDAETYDRSRALERSFAASFAQRALPPAAGASCGGGGAGLAAPYTDYARPEKAAPALLLNTTWVERGFRVAFAPFHMQTGAADAKVGDGTLYAFDDLGRWKQPISLIRAAVASARFPGIMPAATIDYVPAAGQTRRWNFVDGGYADASGATTAYELFEALERHIGSGTRSLPMPVDLRLVLLTDAETEFLKDRIDGSGFSDTLVISNAVLNVRALLAQRAVTRALNSVPARYGDDRIKVLRLVHPTLPLPLGFRISERAEEIVQFILGDASHCRTLGLMQRLRLRRRKLAKRQDFLFALRTENSCAQAWILKRLSPSG
jgi:hypothetical protein